MKFSTRTTYGLRAIIKVAKAREEESISLSQISKQENISLRYLEQIFSLLKKSKIVTSQKGVSGGYQLSRSPGKIKIIEIVKTLEGDFMLFHCLNQKGKIMCGSKCDCGALTVLTKVQNAIYDTLDKLTLKDIM